MRMVKLARFHCPCCGEPVTRESTACLECEHISPACDCDFECTRYCTAMRRLVEDGYEDARERRVDEAIDRDIDERVEERSFAK